MNNTMQDFEEWYCRDGNYEPEELDKWAGGTCYSNADTENMWQAWQGAFLHVAAPVQVAPEPTELQKQKIIGAFLERTRQYVTNDASRQAAIDGAVEKALAQRESAAYLDARDSILNDRGPLEGEGLTSEQTNAVLAVLDDAFAAAPVAPQDDARDAIRREAFEEAALICKFEGQSEEYTGDGTRVAESCEERILDLISPAAKPTEPTLPTQGDAK